MAELTYDQLCERLKRGGLGGSFFLKTDDPFLRDEAIGLLTSTHLEGGSTDFDLDQLSGTEVDASALAAVLETPPMLSSHRVIVIRDAQSLSPSARTVVQEAVTRKVDKRVLIIAAEIPRGSKAKFYDVLRKHCVTVGLRAPASSELPGWLAKRARSIHDVELEMEAAQLLATGIGPRLGVLAQEMEKLVNYVAPGKRIGLEEVRASVGALPQVDRWQWIDKVAERRIGEALEELPDLLDSGESAVALIGAISEALVRVGLAVGGEQPLVRALRRDGTYRNLGWKVKTYARQARGWTQDAIADALEQLFQADRRIKSGGLAAPQALEESLLRIAALGEVSRRPAMRSTGGSRG